MLSGSRERPPYFFGLGKRLPRTSASAILLQESQTVQKGSTGGVFGREQQLAMRCLLLWIPRPRVLESRGELFLRQQALGPSDPMMEVDQHWNFWRRELKSA